MKWIKRILTAIPLFVLLCFAFLYLNHDIGIPEDRLMRDIRQSQNIPLDWKLSGSISDSMAAFISYPEDGSDHTFSVYVNRPGLSFGYFFRGGGDIVAVEKYIGEYTVEGYRERAFISMNRQGAARVEIDGGNEVEIIELDRERPFALILPINAGIVTFYTDQNQPVEYRKQPL